jgi:hypothetical protein
LAIVISLRSLLPATCSGSLPRFRTAVRPCTQVRVLPFQLGIAAKTVPLARHSLAFQHRAFLFASRAFRRTGVTRYPPNFAHRRWRKIEDPAKLCPIQSGVGLPTPLKLRGTLNFVTAYGGQNRRVFGLSSRQCCHWRATIQPGAYNISQKSSRSNQPTQNSGTKLVPEFFTTDYLLITN